jgi:hypothetical protein
MLLILLRFFTHGQQQQQQHIQSSATNIRFAGVNLLLLFILVD